MFITFGYWDMNLRRERVVRPMVDFGDIGGSGQLPGVSLQSLSVEEIAWLVRYMGSNGYRLGHDFHFVMGVDAPAGGKFLAALPGPGVMQYRRSPGRPAYMADSVEVMRSQYISRCIEMIKEDEQRDDHLEVVVDIC